MTLQETRIEVQFVYNEDDIPTYANASIVNVSLDGCLVIDFGFVDPFLINQGQTQIRDISQTNEQDGEQEEDNQTLLTFKVRAKTLNRVTLSQNTATQFLQQIQQALEVMKNINKEK